MIKLKDLLDEVLTTESTKTINIAGTEFPKNFKKYVGFTEIKIRNGKLIISHSGNMGNSIEGSVNPNLKKASMPSIEELKKLYTVESETGSPDYSYSIIFNLS